MLDFKQKSVLLRTIETSKDYLDHVTAMDGIGSGAVINDKWSALESRRESMCCIRELRREAAASSGPLWFS